MRIESEISNISSYIFWGISSLFSVIFSHVIFIFFPLHHYPSYPKTARNVLLVYPTTYHLLPQAKKRAWSNFPLPFPVRQITKTTKFPHQQSPRTPKHHQPPNHQPFTNNHQLSSSSTIPSTTINITIKQPTLTALPHPIFQSTNKLQWLEARENPVASPREARPASMDPRNSRATLARLVSRLVHDVMERSRVFSFLFPPWIARKTRRRIPRQSRHNYLDTRSRARDNTTIDRVAKDEHTCRWPCQRRPRRVRFEM